MGRRWNVYVDCSRIGSAFGRAALRRSAGAFIDGLLSGVARKTGWQLGRTGWT